MTLRVSAQRQRWQDHVRSTAQAYGSGLVPVVKGNGYGLGRDSLHAQVAGLGASFVAVGTLAELSDAPHGAGAATPVVLTPTLDVPSRTDVIVTVGHVEHVRALRGWPGSVIVKLRSSMRRYGVDPDELPALLAAVARGGVRLAGFALHLPLAGTDDERMCEVESWLPHLPGGELWVSHLRPDCFHHLADAHPGHTWRIRVGTALWHGIPRGDFLHLTAEAVQVRAVHHGELVGYRQVTAPGDGWIVAVGAGSSHGIHPLDHDDPARRSPFHFGRRRLVLLEPSHMHTSLCFVADGDPCPAVGDRVDVQQPYVAVNVDHVEWTA